MIPLSSSEVTEREIDAVVAVLRSGRLSLGPQMERFEQLAAEQAGVPYAIAVSSGTAGLHMCVRALGVRAGDEVIVPSFTFISAANVVRYEGATPVFVDVEEQSLNLDPAAIARAITPRTRAILPVHTFGLPANMDAICEIAERHGLHVIEDACEAIGAEIRGRRAGSFGAGGVFAFYPNKQITTGEGGMIVTHDAELARTARALRNQGRLPGDAWHQHAMLGYNYRLSEMNCALGAVQMERLGEILAKREQVARWYTEALAEDARITLPPSGPPDGRLSWFVYVARLPSSARGELRNQVAEQLAAVGIQTGRYFAPVHQQPAYEGWPLPHALPVTERESLRTLALPFFTGLTQDQVRQVAQALRKALDSCC